MILNSGAITSNTYVYSGGAMILNSGAMADYDTYVSSGGDITVHAGADFDDLYVDYGAKVNGFYLQYGNTYSSSFLNIYSAQVQNGDTATLFTGQQANDVSVSSGGAMILHSGAMTSNTNVSAGGKMVLHSGAKASNTTLAPGGAMYISSAGIHQGSLYIESGATVSAYSGAIIDFTLTGRTADDDYLINDLSLISGTPTYTITVSEDQTLGIYKLAQGAESFTGSITVKNENGTNYGSLTVNGNALTYGNFVYSLIQSNGNLLLNKTSIQVNSNVQIYSSGVLTSQGSTIDGAVLASGTNDSMFISSGGTANSTTINTSG